MRGRLAHIEPLPMKRGRPAHVKPLPMQTRATRPRSCGRLSELGGNDGAYLEHVLPKHTDALGEFFGGHRIFVE